ncbi:MAG: ABC transporter substrate-binding protein [Desulfobacterales bacterium]
MAKKTKKMTRRKFIKTIGGAAGAVGISTAIPQLLRPALAKTRDHILIGRPLPMTGPVAAFTQSTPWLDDMAIESINKDGGIFIKEAGKKLPLKLKIVDTESNPTKAASLASRLIMMDKVDIIYVSCTPATVNPVAGVCERMKVPAIGTMNPNEMFLPGGPFKWSFNASGNVSDMGRSFIQSWGQVETTKVVGLCAQNDPDGVAWAQSAGGAVKDAGYQVFDVGRFSEGTNDYTSLISKWKNAKVEVLFANMAPPDFAVMWRQCFQNNFIPKVCLAGRAGLFSAAMEAVGGDLCLGVSCEAVWLPEYPFVSSLTGQNARQFCDAYEKESGKQWTQPLGGLHSGYEIIADALKRAQSLDKESIRQAIGATNMDTLAGPVKFDPNNTAATPVGCMQWVKGDHYPYDAALVASGRFKNLPVTHKLISIPELRKKTGA